MKVILLGVVIPLPRAASKVAHPVVWRLPFTIDEFCRSPNVPVSLGIVFRTFALLKPFVLNNN